MDRWTQAELKSTDNISFAIQILYERRKGLNPYAPLYQKISEAVSELADIRAEKQKFIAGVAKGITYKGSRQQEETQGQEIKIPGWIEGVCSCCGKEYSAYGTELYLSRLKCPHCGKILGEAESDEET